MKSLVNEIINPILEELNQDYTIYFDVDDTLADYTQNLSTFIIKDPETGEDRKIKPQDTVENIDFWINAKPIQGAKEMVDFSKKTFGKVEILSAVPELSKANKELTGKRFYDAPIEGKTEWVSKNIGPLIMNWSKNGKEKGLWASPTSVLVDDKPENVKAFEQAGGIGILMDTPQNVITQLKKLSNPMLNENATYSKDIDYKEKIKELTKYMLDKGEKITPLPKIVFKHGDNNNAKDFYGMTAYYDPKTQTIVLYTEGRHPKDIVRSFAHEMVHHKQNLEGRLGSIDTQNTTEDDHLNKIEKEAYLDGNINFRNWTDQRFSNENNNAQTLEEGIVDKAKELFSNFKIAYKEQKKDFQGFNQLFTKYIKRQELTPEEKDKLVRNVIDIFKMSAIPVLGVSGTALLGALSNFISKGKFSTLPSKFKDKLFSVNEVGEANLEPYKWEEEYTDSTTTTVEFITPSETKYEVYLESTVHVDKDVNELEALIVEFSARPKGEEGSSSKIVVNKGELYRVMSTIVDIIKYYIKKYKAKAILYQPSKKQGEDNFGSQRSSLYKAFIKKALPDAYFEQQGDWIAAILPGNSIIAELKQEPTDSMALVISDKGYGLNLYDTITKQILGYINVYNNNVTGVAAKKGYGPLMYELGMAYVYPNGLQSDRNGNTEPEAEAVLNKFIAGNSPNIKAVKLTPNDKDYRTEYPNGNKLWDVNNFFNYKFFNSNRSTLEKLISNGDKFSPEEQKNIRKLGYNFYDGAVNEAVTSRNSTGSFKEKKDPFGLNAYARELALGLEEGRPKKKDPKKGTGKKPEGSGRRLYTDEDPKDTVSIKFKTKEDIVDTLNKKQFKAKSHARQSQVINLIHQRVRAAYGKAKDPEVKSRLKRALDYIEKRKEASKKKTERLRKMKEASDPQAGTALPYGSGFAPVKELMTATDIICDSCGWKWAIKDGGNDLFICHKCGHDNTLKPDLFGLKAYALELAQGLEEELTQSDLTQIERIADEWFEDYGIDVAFTYHFLDRVNDPRNGKPISPEELEDIFTQAAEKYGVKLSQLPDNFEAILFKVRNDINLPFAINYDKKNDEIDLVAKTIMRKKDFKSSNLKLTLEGRYDSITNQISSAVFKQWKEDFNKGKTESRFEDTFESDDIFVDVDANISFVKGLNKLTVDGGADSETEYLEIRFEIDPSFLPEYWEEISFNLKDVVRHEIEHLTHGEGFNLNPSKFIEDDMLVRKVIDANLLPRAEYFKLEKEIDANLQGMYLRAKKEKRPFKDVIDFYLDSQNITPEEKEEILSIWKRRAKALSLPLFENELNEYSLDPYTIYCDMDGVLSNFDSRFKQFSDNIPPEEYESSFGKNNFWDLIDKKVGTKFWAGMEWMPDGETLWNYISKYNPFILSAPSARPESKIGKRIWMKRNLPGVKLILAKRENKQNYADKSNILIDDRPDNIAEWEANGGIGILHTSAASTIKKLKELGL